MLVKVRITLPLTPCRGGTELLRPQEQEVYALNDTQISAIAEARVQYERGETFTNEDVDREMEEWLKK